MSILNPGDLTSVSDSLADGARDSDLSPSFSQERKRLRWLELCLVLFVAFAPSLVISVYAVATSARLYDATASLGQALAVRTLVGLILQVSAILVLAHVLFCQGRSFRDLGLSFSWKDLPRSVGLALAALVASTVVQVVLWFVYTKLTGQPISQSPRNVEFMKGLSVWLVLYVIFNPFFEEMIVRAFLITEIKMLTGLSSLAVIVSVVLQASYHLYQGVVPALIYVPLFLIFSLYYMKSRRITPVILAHFYFDALALLAYAR